VINPSAAGGKLPLAVPRPLPSLFLLLTAALATAATPSPLTLYALGCLDQHRGDAASALDAFQATRLADPHSLAPANRVALLQQASGDLAAASATLRDFASTHPDQLQAQLHYAKFLTDSSPGDAIARRLAIEALEGADQRFPDQPNLLGLLFRQYENAERREDSMALFRSHLDSADGNAALASALASMARTLFPRADEEGTGLLDALHRTALQAAPGDPTTAKTASEHFRNTGRLIEAVEVLEQHAAAAPESLDLRVRLGILQFAAELDDEGVATLKAVLDIHPRKLLAHQALAKFYRRSEQPAEARHHAAKVLELRGGRASEFLELADELLAEDQPRPARLLLEKAVYHHPDNPKLATRRAIAARRDPETADSCSRLFREAEALATADGGDPPSDPDFLLEFAEALLTDGQSAAAEERLRGAIRQFPAERKTETAAALRRLAGLWQADGRHPEAARALLKRAESLDK